MIFEWEPPISAAAAVVPDYPAITDVKIGVEYDNGDLVGTLTRVILNERQAIDIILSNIGSSSLTDDEWNHLDDLLSLSSTATETYAALLALLDTREAVSTQIDRLQYYFLARGVQVSAPSDAGSSNIFVGGEL